MISKGGKKTGHHKNWFNVYLEETNEIIGVNLDVVAQWMKVEEADEEVNVVLIPKEEHKGTDCVEAKTTELNKLKDFGTYEVDEDKGQNKISTRWVLTRKGDTARPRLVARGFEDQEDVRKDSPTVGKGVMRMMLTIAASQGWTVQSTDIKSAFLQGKEIERDIFIQPPKEWKDDEKEGKIWKLKKCLYGLNEAARQFYQSVTECLLLLGCEKSNLDPAFFYMKSDEKLVGMIACHIDDFLHAGNEEFAKCVFSLRARFKAGRLESQNFKYIGFNIVQKEESIIIDQSQYVQDIEVCTISAERSTQKQEPLNGNETTLLREIVGRLNWAAQGTRPDIYFDMVDLSTRMNKATVSDLCRAVKTVRKLKESESFIMLNKLSSPEDWRLVVFSDASHANLSDGAGSMGAYVLLLVEGNRCCPIAWRAAKIKRVVRSTIAAEALSLLEAIENGLYVKDHLKILLGLTTLPLIAYIDNKSVVDAIHSTRLVEDKRLRIDMASLKELLNNREVCSIQWIPG